MLSEDNSVFLLKKKVPLRAECHTVWLKLKITESLLEKPPFKLASEDEAADPHKKIKDDVSLLLLVHAVMIYSPESAAAVFQERRCVSVQNVFPIHQGVAELLVKLPVFWV